MFSPLSSWQKAWQHIGQHGAGETVRGKDSLLLLWEEPVLVPSIHSGLQASVSLSVSRGSDILSSHPGWVSGMRMMWKHGQTKTKKSLEGF